MYDINYETWKQNEAQLVRELEWRRVALEQKGERDAALHAQKAARKAERSSARASAHAANREHRELLHAQKAAQHQSRLARRGGHSLPVPR